MVMSIKIVAEYPLWFSIFCILLGAIYAGILYYKDIQLKEANLWVRRLMTGLRFLLVTILAFLLLSPFIKTLFNKVEKPVIIIAQDNSSSVLLNKDSTFYKTEYIQQLKQLKDELEENFEVKTYTFGDQLTEGDVIDYSQKITDLSVVFNELGNKSYNRNVGALILATDGIFNQGSNPVFSSENTFPIYTIALGDTSLQKDIVIKEALYNRITFLGNQFPIEISAEAYQCEGDKSILSVTHNGKQLFSKEYNFKENQLSISENLLFEAKEVGVQPDQQGQQQNPLGRYRTQCPDGRRAFRLLRLHDASQAHKGIPAQMQGNHDLEGHDAACARERAAQRGGARRRRGAAQPARRRHEHRVVAA